MKPAAHNSNLNKNKKRLLIKLSSLFLFFVLQEAGCPSEGNLVPTKMKQIINKRFSHKAQVKSFCLSGGNFVLTKMKHKINKKFYLNAQLKSFQLKNNTLRHFPQTSNTNYSCSTTKNFINGFVDLINSIFFSLERSLISFSRAMAILISVKCSK